MCKYKTRRLAQLRHLSIPTPHSETFPNVFVTLALHKICRPRSFVLETRFTPAWYKYTRGPIETSDATRVKLQRRDEHCPKEALARDPRCITPQRLEHMYKLVHFIAALTAAHVWQMAIGSAPRRFLG